MDYRCLLVLTFFGGALTADWSYVGTGGPQNWGKSYETCGATKQSPIDIPGPADLAYDNNLGPFVFTGYGDLTEADLSIKNNGHTVQVSIAEGTLGKAKISGGGLSGNYITAQLHFHWGIDLLEGSEHTFRGRAYPLELHIVHYAEKYGDLASSLGHSDGLAVLGFFFTISEEDNEHLAPLFAAMQNVLYKDQTANFSTGFDQFLASATNEFYRYQGSLTTPPCSEAVIWTVFENKNTISASQLEHFRKLYETEDIESRHEMLYNFRPIQPLGVRTVTKNYQEAVPPSFHWGYHGEEGPEHWKEYYPTCKGNRQSPIDVPFRDSVMYDPRLANLTFINYDQNITGEILNNGHTLQVNIDSPSMYMESGGLNGRYKAAQFHFHWGQGNHGSEHMLQGQAYPMELHIVHYKEEYGSLAGALDYTDGLAVVGFFIVAGRQNDHYKHIIDALPDVQLKGSKTPIREFSLKQISHQDLKVGVFEGNQIPFYRYSGGLTTPPCLQIVTWSVMMAKIHLHADQIAQFRNLAHVSSVSGTLHVHEMIQENYRPVQEIAERTIYTSYDLTDTSGATSLAATSTILAVILLFLPLFR